MMVIEFDWPKHKPALTARKKYFRSSTSSNKMYISSAIGRVASSAFRAPVARLAVKPLGTQAAVKGKFLQHDQHCHTMRLIIALRCY